MKIALRELHENPRGLAGWFAALALLAAAGGAATLYMEHYGHIVTGMNNQIVWGVPHVFAVFLIVAASGALNVASMASVFGKTIYKPLSPLSGLLALALLAGGLLVLVLDLGRPERLIVAMTHYNFRSIFAWNIFLYTGFMAIVVVYLWTQMERRMNVYSTRAGVTAFIWRLVLTTGTGSIFGFLVARHSYDSAVMAPMFIALSLSYGMAIFLLVLVTVYRLSARPLGAALLAQFRRLQAIFVAAGLYFVAVQHLTNLYLARRIDFERFILLDGGVHTWMFWGVQVLIGGVLPLVLLLAPRWAGSLRALMLAAAGVTIGGVAQMYVTIIGGQAWPLQLFPGMQVVSSFQDGVIGSYTPSLPEILLGLGGLGVAGLIVLVAVRVLAFVPERLDDEALAA